MAHLAWSLLFLSMTGGDAIRLKSAVVSNATAVLGGAPGLHKFMVQNKQKLHSCDDYEKDAGFLGSPEDKALSKAWKPICENPEWRHLGDLWIQPGFEAAYDRFYGKDGWLDEAYVSYMALPKVNDETHTTDMQILSLAKSIHANSERPLVVVNFGDVVSTKYTAANYPRMILFHANDLSALPKKNKVAFNFNKFRSIMMTKVRTGVQLDADQIVFGKADRMFQRTKEEITEKYPYPMLPVHWMSRDDDPGGVNGYAAYNFHCKHCAKPTQRWGHAHPTYTFHALPFFGETFKDVLNHRKLEDGFDLGNLEDEDALNVFLWEKKAEKQWCKFDIPWVADFNKFIQGKGDDTSSDEDWKWYPHGTPKVFYTAHHATNYKENIDALMAFALNRTELMKQKPILFRQDDKRDAEHVEWFETGAELKAAHPDMPCII